MDNPVVLLAGDPSWWHAGFAVLECEDRRVQLVEVSSCRVPVEKKMPKELVSGIVIDFWYSFVREMKMMHTPNIFVLERPIFPSGGFNQSAQAVGMAMGAMVAGWGKAGSYYELTASEARKKAIGTILKQDGNKKEVVKKRLLSMYKEWTDILIDQDFDVTDAVCTGLGQLVKLELIDAIGGR